MAHGSAGREAVAKAKRVRAVMPIPNSTPWCSGKVDRSNTPPWYRKRREAALAVHGRGPDECDRRSSYCIDGAYYCAVHAGQEALRILCAQ